MNASPEPDKLSKVIERAKQQLERMIDLNPQVMLLVDKDARVVRANRAFLDFVKVGAFPKALGKSLDDFFSCDDPQFFRNILKSGGGYASHEKHVKVCNETNRMIQFSIVGPGNRTDPSVVVIQDVTDEKQREASIEKQHKKEAVKALAGALMHNINQPLTVIMVQAQMMQVAVEKGNIDPDELKKNLQDIMQLTTQIADLVENAQDANDFVTQSYSKGVDILDIRSSGARNQELTAKRDALLQVLSTALDRQGPGLALHAARTASFAAHIAERMGLQKSDIEAAGKCARLHDMGKIGIPCTVLTKPTALTQEEMDVMKAHAEIGHDILRHLPFLEEEALTAYSHHEHFDGNGYPRGLKRKDIPFNARLTAVADVFETVRSGRSYQAAVSLEDAAQCIIAGSGKQFDPDIVDTFQKCYKELDELTIEQT
jgi:HD-GYP domain-containing protein (c-di-GMP phosphodiesterase class II)